MREEGVSHCNMQTGDLQLLLSDVKRNGFQVDEMNM